MDDGIPNVASSYFIYSEVRMTLLRVGRYMKIVYGEIFFISFYITGVIFILYQKYIRIVLI